VQNLLKLLANRLHEMAVIGNLDIKVAAESSLLLQRANHLLQGFQISHQSDRTRTVHRRNRDPVAPVGYGLPCLFQR